MRNSVFAVEHGLRQRDRHDHQFVGIHAQALAGRRQHADDAEAAVADAHHWPSAGAVPNSSSRTLAPITASDGAALPVALRQEAPLRQLQGGGSRATATWCRPPVISRSLPPALIADVPTASGATRRTADAAQQRLRIVEGQVARRVGDGIAGVEAAGLRTAGQHDHQVGAERGELVRPRSAARRRRARSAPPPRPRRSPSPAPSATCAAGCRRRRRARSGACRRRACALALWPLVPCAAESCRTRAVFHQQLAPARARRCRGRA